jgi:uncharacterized protein (DUF433 family)
MIDLFEYFDFQAPDDIRLKGHRIGIESILYEYIHHGRPAEEIAALFPTLRLEHVYATILYYLRDRTRLDQYVANWLEFGRRGREDQALHPTPFVQRMRQLKAETEQVSP